MDLAADPALARRIMERILEVKLAYWERLLPQLDGIVDVVGEADDLGGQDRTLFSPATYRALVKPLHRELFAYLHAHTDARVFFHTCGAVRELIPDLIEIGVDVLNPVQVSAAGMDTAELKREFGARPRVLGRRRGHAAGARRRDARRGAGRGAAARARTWRPAAGSCSRPSTTSSRTSRRRTSSRCVDALREGGRWLRSCAGGSSSPTRCVPGPPRRSRTAGSRPSSRTRTMRSRRRARSTRRASSTSTSTAGAATPRPAMPSRSRAWPARCSARA